MYFSSLVHSIRYHIARFLTIIVAIQVLNVSIYPEVLQSFREENPSALPNEMDTVVEYVTEIVLGYQNVFPEYPHKHQKEMQLHKHGSISLFSEEFADNILPPSRLVSRKHLLQDKYSYQFYKEINPPPPKI